MMAYDKIPQMSQLHTSISTSEANNESYQMCDALTCMCHLLFSLLLLWMTLPELEQLLADCNLYSDVIKFYITLNMTLYLTTSTLGGASSIIPNCDIFSLSPNWTMILY